MKFCEKATPIFLNWQNHPFFSLKQVAKNFTHFKVCFWGESVITGLSTGYSCRHCLATIWKKKVPLKDIHQ
jgi:hypothetical protein